MIFPYVLFDAIVVAKTKTVTRRPCVSKSGRTFRPLAVGDVLPLQRGYAKATAWARVVSVQRQDAFAGNVLQHAEGVREGFVDAWAFQDAWCDIYGAEPVDVYRIEFKLVAHLLPTANHGHREPRHLFAEPERRALMPAENYDSRPDTYEHIGKVRGYLQAVAADLTQRGHVHDASKLLPPEKEAFDIATPRLKGTTYGSPEYREGMTLLGPALTHHYKFNDHHPEHFAGEAVECYSGGYPDSCWRQGSHMLNTAGVRSMNLMQITEMLCDWKAATERHDDGDLARSIEINAERYGYGDEIKGLLLNTAHAFGWISPRPKRSSRSSTKRSNSRSSLGLDPFQK